MAETLSFQSPLYSLTLQDPGRPQARGLLLSALHASKALAFQYAPIDVAAIARLAGSSARVKSAGELSSAISSIKASQLEGNLASFVQLKTAPASQEGAVPTENAKKEKGSPAEFAFSCYLNCLFEGAFPPAKLSADSSATHVRIVSNFGGWQVVRKASISAEKKEVVACSASIFESVRKKLPEYLCLEGREAEHAAAVEGFLSKFPERRSFSRLPEILSAASQAESSITAFAEKGFERNLLELFYYRVFERVGYPPFVSTDQVSRIYPELKIPKPRGRIAGAKK